MYFVFDVFILFIVCFPTRMCAVRRAGLFVRSFHSCVFITFSSVRLTEGLSKYLGNELQVNFSVRIALCLVIKVR